MSASRRGTSVLDPVVALGAALREEGVPTTTERLVGFARAAELLPPADLYWAGRATLVSSRAEIAAFDTAFLTVFGDRPLEVEAPRTERLAVSLTPAVSGTMSLEMPADSEVGVASATEVLRRKSFAECTPDELAEIALLVRRLRIEMPRRRSRRRGPARAGEPDLRRTFRLALQTGGEPIRRAFRARRVTRRRLLLLLDVSGSMAAYSRGLMLFAHAAMRAEPRWNAFAFGTRLTRLSEPLSAPAAHEALERAAAAALDWDGGTRIGESLKTLLDLHGRTRAVRGAVTIIMSDGLDVGDPELLADQMARLSRLSHRLLWLNPLMENPEYAPLARGMAAALPHIDLLAPGHNLESLESVAQILGRVR